MRSTKSSDEGRSEAVAASGVDRPATRSGPAAEPPEWPPPPDGYPPMPLRFRLARALALVHLVASMTLIRSIVFDRWITVLASLVLLAGAAAARRGKIWGVGLALGAAAAFPMAWALGMAPGWFLAVGAIGAMPFALTWRSMARFDAKATSFGAWLAITVGLLAAAGWRVFGPSIVWSYPSLRPGIWPAHEGLAMLATSVLMLVGWSNRRAYARAFASADATDGLAFAPAHATDALAFAPAHATDALALASPPARSTAPTGVRVLDAPPPLRAAELAPPEADDELADDALLPPAARRGRA
jgi:hypothetical protein